MCDLPSKSGAVDVEKDFEISWEVSQRGNRQLTQISNALENASQLILATDPDREGEAIAWHVVEQLKPNCKLEKKTVQRVSFNRISKEAITEAMEHPREVPFVSFLLEKCIPSQIDRSLVDAYLARRVIDYLMGFSVSPVLWRKLPGARSAGIRVSRFSFKGRPLSLKEGYSLRV